MTTPAGPYVRYAVDGGVATLTLDSPHNRNAISTRLVAEFSQGLTEAAVDPAVRAVVLTHTGGTFCAGADLAEAAAGAGAADPAQLAAERTQAMTTLLRSIVELPKPVVGRIDGHVRAGGMGLVGACDIVVAGPKCTFALTEARLGLAASIISLTVLPRLTSRAASRYFLTGEKFGPAEAERLGLVTVAADDAVEVTAGIVEQLRLGSPQGLAESKALTTAATLAAFDERAEGLAAQSARLFGTPEAMEGMMAFLQKRRPSWAQ
ncbi:enoyl-CoA hydratase family protein [Rhodococcus sp. D2-41]|uniref:enoyl-CoA hydratase family protein n=1 Tax=Speluncibacter jeojiensis TaxID=2710754 RepID=UPI00240FAEE8|nr:enoyl-CoA hydratase family protein [Rhodococcus sp. D2-41]MDG3009122.1 enoyl-CoA hydratase family protein [Rhodococcus sp. D2-41]